MSRFNETYRLTPVTLPATEPVTLNDVKEYCQVETDADDALLSGFLSAAREWVETHTGRQLNQATYDLQLDCFPQAILIPKPPLVSVDEVAYIDSNEVEQVVAAGDWTADGADGSRLARLVPAAGTSWPATARVPIAVRVRFTCGGTVPAMMANAIKDYVKGLYDFGRPDLEKLELWLNPYVVHRWA